MNIWINKGCRSEYVYISFLPQLFPHSLLTTEDFVTEWKLMLGISSFFPSIYMFGFIRRACISLLNPLPLKLVTIWHPQPFSLYLRHGFCSKLDDVEENRVKWICDPVYYQINIAISLLSSVLINKSIKNKKSWNLISISDMTPWYQQKKLIIFYLTHDMWVVSCHRTYTRRAGPWLGHHLDVTALCVRAVGAGSTSVRQCTLSRESYLPQSTRIKFNQP